MGDQFPPDQNSAKDYFVFPESGPGKEAANFSADAQREKFLGGSSLREAPKPEVERPSPTKASNSLLEMTKQIIKKDWPYILPITVGAALATGIDAPLVAKGLVAGASLVPLALKTFRRG